MSSRLRLGWFAAVVFVAIFGIGNLAIWIADSLRGHNWWAEDLFMYDAARRVIDGAALYQDPKYFYPPLAALLGIPLLAIDRFSASLVLAAGKLLLAAICVLWLTQTWRSSSRGLAFIGLVTSLPFLHDLMLGNTNVFIVAAMVPAVFGRSHPRNGLLLGLAAAAFAKPLMIPVLLWLAIWRRETFAGAVVTGALGSAVALVYFGPNSYADWMAALGAGSTWLYSPWAGNHGIAALVPALWLPVAAVTAMALVVVLARCGPRTGIVWAAASGILLAPYVGTYGALPLAITLPAIGPLSPVLAVAIVAASPIATTHPLPFYAAAIMLAALAFRERRAANESVGMATTAAWEPAAAA